MANSSTQPAHEWWKDKSDPTERAAFTDSYRSSQREQHRAGWRRNVMIGILVLAVPVLIHLLTAA
ncbi:MAG: hypothetical protein EOO22_16135 [Comamonadaceae bacterium]|nr:MAG: hypothetical protein EOO22_16135 [Comamonadaceae bacterium]